MPLSGISRAAVNSSGPSGRPPPPRLCGSLGRRGPFAGQSVVHNRDALRRHAPAHHHPLAVRARHDDVIPPASDPRALELVGLYKRTIPAALERVNVRPGSTQPLLVARSQAGSPTTLPTAGRMFAGSGMLKLCTNATSWPGHSRRAARQYASCRAG